MQSAAVEQERELVAACAAEYCEGETQAVLALPASPTKDVRQAPHVLATDWQSKRFRAVQFGADEHATWLRTEPVVAIICRILSTLP
jgi:hypothetical protein